MALNQLDLLKRRISLKLISHTSIIVGLDGACGVGKSTLAKRLLEEFEGSLVSLDDYLEPHNGGYIEYLGYQKLNKDIHNLLSQNTSLLITEGICLLAALERVGISLDIFVYIKSIDQYGKWNDQSICGENRDLPQILESISRYESLPGIGNSDRELATYHKRYSPVAKADFILSKLIGSSQDFF